jgi:transcription-repair coupling factor (superfamily II helicase)
LGRGGQVYYVSNRVKNIEDAVERVAAAAPEARIEVAHGQMSEHQLEAAMERFAANQVDVLVATTIIESGLDNPHSNTLIIEDSQRLGLAQLYQLKGRVGRSHAQAYAYFLFPAESRLTPEAVDRLTAINEYQELGSGMRIAMRDLEIRGAGSLLGAEQHGNLQAVGFDLFASMLSEAVEAARLGDTGDEKDADIRVDLPVHAYLPEEFIAATDERVLYYRKIAGAAQVEDLDKLSDQMQDKFGGMPAPAINLVDRAKAKLLLAELGATSVFQARGKLNVNDLELTADQAAAIKHQGGTYMVKSHKLLYPVVQGAAPLASLLALLDSLLTDTADEEADDSE